ncbi:hypothetical protein [Demequina oxidasica]|uniref:hypothetical protein n=1 Tax=Demequina oxidasica TaxID=676199 RepID=UPI000780D7FA|nr:hypothetical protein [Demequina oxidasica]
MSKDVANQRDARTPIVRLRDRYKSTFQIGIGSFVLAVIGFLIDANSSSYVIGDPGGNAAAFGFAVFAGWVAGLLLLIGGAGWMVASLLIAAAESRRIEKASDSER